MWRSGADLVKLSMLSATNLSFVSHDAYWRISFTVANIAINYHC